MDLGKALELQAKAQEKETTNTVVDIPEALSAIITQMSQVLNALTPEMNDTSEETEDTPAAEETEEIKETEEETIKEED